MRKKRLSKIQQNEERLVKLGLVKKRSLYCQRIHWAQGRRGNRKFKTIWEGYPEEEFTWESLKGKLKEVPKLVEECIKQLNYTT